MKARVFFGMIAFAWGYPGGLSAQLAVHYRGEFPSEIRESSGLILLGDQWVTLNDSGNSPDLFVLDTTSLRLVRRVRIRNTTNTDWEDLAQDREYLYIADIGNNLGARRDLRILRVLKSDFFAADTVDAEEISFAYEGQTDFSGTANSDWDAEALLADEQGLWVFTKQWQGLGTAAFQVPKEPGRHVARRVGDYPAGGLITGATPLVGSGEFLLLGYSPQLQPFLIRVPAPSPSDGFPAATERLELDWGFAQAEGISALSNGRVFMSTERFEHRFATLPAGLFSLDLGGGESHPVDPGEENEGSGGSGAPRQDMGLILYGSPGTGLLRYELGEASPVLAQAVFDTSGRLVLLEQGVGVIPGQLDVSSLGRAVYYLTVFLPDQRLSKPFIRY